MERTTLPEIPLVADMGENDACAPPTGWPENLRDLKETLRRTFLGARWRYRDLQGFIEQKAKEAGIEVRRVNPRYTSRRCSQCGHLHLAFDRVFRDANREGGKTTRFQCPMCAYEDDPDYNAARNLAVLDIERLIERQLKNKGWLSEKTSPPPIFDKISITVT